MVKFGERLREKRAREFLEQFSPEKPLRGLGGRPVVIRGRTFTRSQILAAQSAADAQRKAQELERKEAEKKARELEAIRKAQEAKAKKARDELRRLEELKRRTREKSPSVISAAEKKRELEGLQSRINRKRRSLIGKETIAAQATGAALGFGSALVGTARFIQQTTSSPIKTAKSIPSGLGKTKKFVTSGKLARVVREEPGFVTGAVAGEVAIAKGGQVVIVKGGRITGATATRLGPGFKRVETIKTKAGVEKAIRNLKKIGGKGELRIIPAGKAGPRKVSTGGKKDNFVTLFHGTTLKNAKNILKTGLNKKSFLTKSKSKAFDFLGENQGAVLKIRVPKSDLKNFRQISKIKNLKVETGNLKISSKNIKVGDVFKTKKTKASKLFKELSKKVDKTKRKKVKLEPTLPSIRGGFRFSKAEQKAILKAKAKGPTVSSAKNLFSIVRRKIKIKPGTEPGGKQFGFFGTPPVKGIGFIRESRLGLGQKPGRFIDLIKGEVTIGKTKPQIIVIKESKGFKGTGFKSSELETTLKPGLVLKKTGRVGTTVLGKGVGQRVPIITAKVVKGTKEASKLFKKAATGKKLSALEKSKLKKATGFTTKEISRSFIPKRRISPSALSAQISKIRKQQIRTRKETISKRTTPAKRITTPGKRIIRDGRPGPKRPIRPTGGGPRPKPRPDPRPRPKPRPTPKRGPSPRPTPKPKPRPRPVPRPGPGPPPIPPEIKEILEKIRKKKKKVTKSDVALVEGFTAKILGLKPIKITKANLKKKIKEFQTVKLRRRPVFVKSTPKKKVKRGKKR